MEIWKDIPNYEGLYKISNFGNVFSYYRNKILTLSINKYGYRFIFLVKFGYKKWGSELLV